MVLKIHVSQKKGTTCSSCRQRRRKLFAFSLSLRNSPNPTSALPFTQLKPEGRAPSLPVLRALYAMTDGGAITGFFRYPCMSPHDAAVLRD